MLEKLALDSSLDSAVYKRVLPGLQRRLFDLQKACWDHRIPSMIVFEGWDGSGRGKAIGALTARLDPRGFKLHRITAPAEHEARRPWLWRFWNRLPNHGEMAIFDRSWYGRVLHDRVEKVLPEAGWRQAYRDITEFERMQADDGMILVKFWMHIAKKEQKRRLKALEKNPLEAWRVTEADWRSHKMYEEYVIAVEEMLHETETEYAPWTIVEAHSKYYARHKICETVIAALEQRLGPLAPVDEDRERQDAGEAGLRLAISRSQVLVGEEA